MVTSKINGEEHTVDVPSEIEVRVLGADAIMLQTKLL